MSDIHVTYEEEIAIIALNRPPANALSIALLNELEHVIEKLKDDEDIRVIILHGEGRFFAAGADIKEFTTVSNGREFTKITRNVQQFFKRIEDFPKPIIAAIHGAALGGGLELAMACHIRLTTKETKLGLPELQLGLIPGFAGSQRLPRFVGTAKAAEMILTSEPITGAEALTLGLVNSIHTEESLMEDARTLAIKIAQKSTVSVKMALELLRYSNTANLDEGSIQEAELFGKAFDSIDGQEGIKAFIEKRKPNFKNQ